MREGGDRLGKGRLNIGKGSERGRGGMKSGTYHDLVGDSEYDRLIDFRRKHEYLRTIRVSPTSKSPGITRCNFTLLNLLTFSHIALAGWAFLVLSSIL